VSSSLIDVVPHMIIRSPHLRLGKLCSVTQKEFCNTIGTFQTSRDVRYLVAIQGKADVARTSRFCSDDPKETFLRTLTNRQSGRPLSESPQSSRRPKHQHQNNRPNNTPSNPCDVRVSCLPFENFLMNDHQECPRLISGGSNVGPRLRSEPVNSFVAQPVEPHSRPNWDSRFDFRFVE
jgi:hypothetical protein